MYYLKINVEIYDCFAQQQPGRRSGMYNYELVDQFPTCLGLSVAQKGLGDVGGNKLDRCRWQMQGERLSVSCAELRTAVSKARRANRGQETMGFDVRRPTARNVHCL